MAATPSPYGLRPISRQGGRGGDLNYRMYALGANNTNPIYNNDLVTLSGGNIIPIAAKPTVGTRDANIPIGVCQGCNFMDPVMGMRYQQYLPATAVASGYTNIVLEIVDDPWALFQVQADGPVTAASIGKNADLNFPKVTPMTGTKFWNGDTATGNSLISLNSASIATPGVTVRIVELVNEVGVSTPGDAYTDCIVMICPAVHAFTMAAGG